MTNKYRLLTGKNTFLLGDQVICSASNAAGVIVAAVLLTGSDLNYYVTLQLIGTTLIGLQRALFLDPSLVVHGENNTTAAYGKWIWGLVLPITVLTLIILLVIGFRHNALIIVISLLFPIVQDCMRYRSMAYGKYSQLLISDSIWLGVLVGGAVTLQPANSYLNLLLWGGGAAIAAPFLLFREKGLTQTAIRPSLSLGRYQLTEWTIAMTTSVIPLLVVQATLPSSSVAAFRLAQTLMGPLNTLSNFVMVRFLLDARLIKLYKTDQIKLVVRKVSLMIFIITTFYGIFSCMGLYLARSWLDPALIKQVAYAVPVTVGAALLTSPCSPYLGLARSLSMQKLTIRPQFYICLFTVLATFMGFWLWDTYGLDPLVIPVLSTALASLFAYRAMFMRTIDRVSPGIKKAGDTNLAATH